MKESTTRSGGVGFLGLLTILFIGLKLAGIITWAWWLVLLPLYAGIALFILSLFVTFMAIIAAGTIMRLFDR